MSTNPSPQTHTHTLATAHEPHPDPVALTSSNPNTSELNYTPNPSLSIPLSPSRQQILNSITALYSGSCVADGTGEQDMLVYAREAIYDDPWSYCDSRFKIAGQWYGMPMIMVSSKTLATEVVKSSDDEIVFKLQQEYRPKLLPVGKAVDSLVSLKLIKEGDVEKVIYHKDMWNAKDYSHEGLGKVFKTLNGDYLTGITGPPKSL
ncbi:hypothetical protein SBOR_8695 [Sclerotinia borealis F-4128]|uniref:Uncharacterized protein n=1 Tax=Sclerotinia borealis (strain F-4128) TaxID=1432307 RepID=W9C5D5_SCLBF|nr:hypothetical protein SBOR_8695 [Sclerotinia borealis F-4128]